VGERDQSTACRRKPAASHGDVVVLLLSAQIRSNSPQPKSSHLPSDWTFQFILSTSPCASSMLYVKLPYCCARARQLVAHKTHRFSKFTKLLLGEEMRKYKTLDIRPPWSLAGHAADGRATAMHLPYRQTMPSQQPQSVLISSASQDLLDLTVHHLLQQKNNQVLVQRNNEYCCSSYYNIYAKKKHVTAHHATFFPGTFSLSMETQHVACPAFSHSCHYI